MNNSHLYELITAYVDGELSPAEEEKLLELAKENKSVRSAIEAEDRLKRLVKSKLSRASAPEQLKLRIDQVLAEEKQRQQRAAANTQELESRHPADKPSGGRNRFLFSIAALVVAGLFLVLIQQFTTGVNDVPSSAITVEQLTYDHYINNKKVLLTSEFGPITTTDAQIRLKEVYDCSITVPELQGAAFVGVIYADFHDGYQTPLLEYKVAEGDYIYMFAFEMHNLNVDVNLMADDDAQQAIVRHDDVYIKNVNGYDVVSWKWGEVWYTAVSDHSGEVLAAMLPH